MQVIENLLAQKRGKLVPRAWDSAKPKACLLNPAGFIGIIPSEQTLPDYNLHTILQSVQ